MSPDEQARQWAALVPLAAQGGVLACVIVQTRLHGIRPTLGLAIRADGEAVRAPFLAREKRYVRAREASSRCGRRRPGKRRRSVSSGMDTELLMTDLRPNAP